MSQGCSLSRKLVCWGLLFCLTDVLVYCFASAVHVLVSWVSALQLSSSPIALRWSFLDFCLFSICFKCSQNHLLLVCIVVNLQVKLGKTIILTMLSHPLQEQGISFYLCLILCLFWVFLLLLFLFY